MFNILIVEDNQDKLRNIVTVLKSINGIDEELIEHVVDAHEAKKKMIQISYNLLIIDIAIPPKKSEPIDIEGGIKLLKEIIHREIYKIPTHIIGLTALDAIFTKASVEFETQILSVIRYSNTDLEWQTRLFNGVEQWVQSKTASIVTDLKYDFDIAIITALDIEFAAVKLLSSDWQKVSLPNDPSPYYETTFKNDKRTFRVIAACAPQMGMNASAVLSMKMIYNFRPEYLFMTGIAASVKKSDSHGYGDVLVIDESWDGGAGKITENSAGEAEFYPVAQNLRMNKDISEKFRSFKDNYELLRKIKDAWKPGTVPNTELSIHIGSVASVAGVIENSAIINQLKIKDRKLLGLEMEAHGLYYSAINCSNPKPTAIALKAVSDFANLDKSDIFQGYASYTSAKVMYEFILSEL